MFSPEILLKNKKINVKPKALNYDIDSLYTNMIRDLSNSVISSHKSFISSQKSFFKSLTKEIVDTATKGADTAIDIIVSSKNKTYGEGIGNSINKGLDSFVSYIFKHNCDTLSQVKFINSAIKHYPQLKYNTYTMKAIKFESDFFLTDKEFHSVFMKFYLDHRFVKEFDFPDLTHAFDKRLYDALELEKFIFGTLKTFSKERQYSVSEIMDIFDKYRVRIKEYFGEYKSEIQYLKNTMHHDIEKVKKDYADYVEDINNDKYMTQADKDRLIKIATSSLKMYSDLIINIINTATIAYRTQYKIAVDSLKKICFVINMAYDDIYDQVKGMSAVS